MLLIASSDKKPAVVHSVVGAPLDAVTTLHNERKIRKEEK